MPGTAPKPPKDLGGDTPAAGLIAYGPPSIPADPSALWAAIIQLQNTVNALIVKFNAHYHTETLASAQVWSGGVVSAGSALAVDVTAGEVRKSDGSFQAFVASTDLALTTAHATLDRVDLIQVATADGTVSKKNGTASATPVAPAVDAGNVALATVAVAHTATVPGTITDVRARPGVETGAVPAPALQVDGTAQSASNLFTAS